MSLQITGMKKLKANYYNKVIISENPLSGCYMINVRGDKLDTKTVTVGDRFSDDFKKLSEEDQVREVINDFVSHNKICGITDPITALNGKMFNTIYANYGYKQLLLQIFNSRFSDVSKQIQDKYYQDRFDFCYDENGIKTFRIEISRYGSFYDLELDNLYNGSSEVEYFKVLKLKTKDQKLLTSEKRFIQEFIVNVCSKYNEEIQVERVYDENTSDSIVEYVLRCGDVRIAFPDNEALLFIFVVIKGYNSQLKNINNSFKKRQLKMEGFENE